MSENEGLSEEFEAFMRAEEDEKLEELKRLFLAEYHQMASVRREDIHKYGQQKELVASTLPIKNAAFAAHRKRDDEREQTVELAHMFAHIAVAIDKGLPNTGELPANKLRELQQGLAQAREVIQSFPEESQEQVRRHTRKHLAPVMRHLTNDYQKRYAALFFENLAK